METPYPFVITPEAQTQIDFVLSQERDKEQKEVYFRIAIEAGGCSGFQYVFSFDTLRQEDDKLLGTLQGPVIVDNMSYGFIEGAQLVYEEDLMGSTFIIKKNPKAQVSCGCGASFSPL